MRTIFAFVIVGIFIFLNHPLALPVAENTSRVELIVPSPKCGNCLERQSKIVGTPDSASITPTSSPSATPTKRPTPTLSPVPTAIPSLTPTPFIEQTTPTPEPSFWQQMWQRFSILNIFKWF